jgi:flagellar biosynthesis anti-sigma factor FlgM
MRIDLNSGAAISGSQTEKTAVSHSAPASAATSNKAELSENTLGVGKLTAVALNAPEVRAERIQTLQSRLESGNYKVSATEIADSMLAQMRVRGS